MNHLKLKNHYREQRFFQRRLISIAAIAVLLVLCLIARLVYLQVFERNLYKTLSKKNQLSLIPIEPKRGLIYDRNGVLLAENIPVFSLDIIPGKVKHLSSVIKALKKYIVITPEDIKDFKRELHQKRPFEPVPLKIKLSASEVAKFSVNRWRFPGVEVNARLIRYYPLGKTMANVLGYMGRITSTELSHMNKANYSATNYIGKVGVEKFYENTLHGKVGYQQVETDAGGHIVRILKRKSPIAGNNIFLSIDAGLQKVTQNAFKGISGAAVAIDPSTGEILALASFPSYNPNLFVDGITEKKYLKLQNSPKRPLFNRAIRGLYAPGSTIKPFYGLEGLASGIITPSYEIYDPGYFKYGDHVYMNWLHSGFGWVNLQKAIIVSDDTYFYNLAVRMGVTRMDALLRKFGFGQATSIEMSEELSGTVPTPKWKKGHTGHPWYTGDTINMGIGQGYLLATPLQIADAIATLAERGKRFQPHLLLYSQTPKGIDIQQTPTPLKQVSMPQKDWHYIINSMIGVIKAKDGTGWRFGRDANYSVAAKTGTAQVYTEHAGSGYTKNNLPEKLRDNSLFIAFAPVKHPKIAVAIVVEHADTAPLIARQMMDYYLVTEPKLKHEDKLKKAANEITH